MTDQSAAPPVAGAHTTRRPLPPSRPHLIRSDAEALQVARDLAAQFRSGAAERDRTRRPPWSEIEQYTASRLGGITVPRAYGGADVSYRTLSDVFEIL
jgi:alkylation response protein AidB-like acyl-CoA dehydrogenase